MTTKTTTKTKSDMNTRVFATLTTTVNKPEPPPPPPTVTTQTVTLELSYLDACRLHKLVGSVGCGTLEGKYGEIRNFTSALYAALGNVGIDAQDVPELLSDADLTCELRLRRYR